MTTARPATMPPAEATTFNALADRAGQLFSPPAVAMEVLRLTDEPSVDARELCRCIEGDPALASKLLRVVNSSLYGLPQEVASLSQAIALLGVQPLKLLVLGFSLPDGLTNTLTGDALRRYWTDTLTTATAARLVAEAGWKRLGDEALAAGLMQGVGQLVMLSQLGDNYATLLAATAGSSPLESPRSIEPIEREALGFDHRQLSAELVKRWRLPKRLADAIDEQATDDVLDHLQGDEACLAQSLRLANQMNRLVTRREFGVLRDLITQGNLYCGLNQRQMNAIVDALQVQTGQLAQAMSAPLIEGMDYHQALIEAHARLSLISESQAVRMMSESRTTDEVDEDERLYRDLLLETRRLSAAAQALASGGLDPRTDTPDEEGGEAKTPAPHTPPAPKLKPTQAEAARRELIEKTNTLIAKCRKTRSPLTLAIMQLTNTESGADPNVMAIRDWLKSTAWETDFERATWAVISRNQSAVWLPGLERIEANRLWSAVSTALANSTPLRLDVGIAGVVHATRSFEGSKLLEAAERCLSAAADTAGPTTKSIEVF